MGDPLGAYRAIGALYALSIRRDSLLPLLTCYAIIRNGVRGPVAIGQSIQKHR